MLTDDRDTLLASDLDAFAEYMETRGYRREPTNPNHGYEALRLRPSQGGLLILYYDGDGERVAVRPRELRAVRDFHESRPSPAPGRM